MSTGVRLLRADALALANDVVAKVCKRCQKIKSFDEFSKDKHGKYGLCSICKLCDRERGKSYYKTHYEQEHAKKLAYARDHKSEAIIRHRRWYIANREMRIIQIKKYRLDNPEWWKNYQALWVKNNPDKVKEKYSRWRKTHVEKTRERCRRRKALLRKNKIGKVDYQQILWRDGFYCHICGELVNPQDVQFDHIIPLSKGGPHSMDNISVAHAKCNMKKKDKILEPRINIKKWIEPEYRI
jgi:5-methylcytosine-specific restriction endonuclease McrA